jgi:hypothetical protein
LSSSKYSGVLELLYDDHLLSGDHLPHSGDYLISLAPSCTMPTAMVPHRQPDLDLDMWCTIVAHR